MIVYERLIDEERRSPAGLLSSLNMLIMTAGGFDFSGADVRRLDERHWFPRHALASRSTQPIQ